MATDHLSRTQRLISTSTGLALAALIACAPLAGASAMGLKASAPPNADRGVEEIRQALAEQRYVDAERLLDQAAIAGVTDPRLTVQSGELDLHRGAYKDALDSFERAAKLPSTHADALAGKGVALALLGKSDEAMSVLKAAVAEKPDAWRAWNALGSEYDRRAQWQDAEAAYAKALEASSNAAIVLNNRGYSRMLQHRPREAVGDLITALQKAPDLAAARTNLRLALAMDGNYDKASAGSATDDRATLLNNAGFAAATMGDYQQAEKLLTEAVKARSAYYDRASDNLALVKAMKSQDKTLASRIDPK